MDGPSADILSLNGLSIARDGTGGLVYLKDVGGVAHVFVSGLRNGVFQAPVQVDAGLAGASSQPQIAVANDGLTVAAFINGGQLYAVAQPNALSPWQAPVVLHGAGSSNPSLSMSIFGKAYLAYTASAGAGDDILAAYYANGGWQAASSALNVTPGDDAGTGTEAPHVATANDGTALVVWGENGHIDVRRVLGASPSVVYQQADPSSFDGWTETSADEPVIASGGDSSFAAVAFRENLSSGGATQSRVLISHIRATTIDGLEAGDILTTPGAESSSDPQVAVTDYGTGWVTAQGDTSGNVFVTNLGSNENPEARSQANSLTELGPPYAVPAAAGLTSTFVAWQQYNGSSGVPEIRMRYADDGVNLEPEQVVSSPTLGATDAAGGLAAAGDLDGDAALAWVQGSGPTTRIVTAQLFQGPKSFSTTTSFAYSRSVDATFSWVAPSESWGPLTYVVRIDGVVVGSTQGTSLVTPALTQGRHRWQVTATNLAGLSSSSGAATVFVDSIPPRLTATFSGARHVGDRIHLKVLDSDVPPGVPAAAASGIVSLQVGWGDGARATFKHYASHVFTRRGTFTVTLTLTDRAGNQTVVRRRLKITVPPKPKPKPKKHKKHKKKG